MSTIPTSQTIPAWFIDPVNGNDGYDGVNSAFVSGLAGPLKTWAQLVARWGTASPRLEQNTIITFVSSHTNNSDPVYFRPFVENGAFVSIRGVLGAAQQIATGVLGTVTAKNRTTPQLLQVILPAGSYSPGMLIVNSTHSSRAWLYTLVTGTTWNITQPLTPTNPASPSLTATEVDTWTAGDTVTIYQPIAINIADFTPKFTDLNTSTFNNMVTTYQLTVLDPGGVGNDFLSLGTDSSSFDCLETNFQRAVNINNQRGVIGTGFVNCFMQGVLSSTGTFTIKLLGGVALNSLNAGTFNLAGDFILATGAITGTTNLQYTSVYLETGTVLAIGSGSTFVQSGAPRIIWGPGSINLLGTATLTYLAGAGGAAATFLLTGGITINGSTTAYSINNNTLNSNISITPANLDAPAGPSGFGGTAFLPSGGIITNGTSTQSSALTQAAWFIDPLNGSDGYTGTNATFTSGTTGPIKTKAEIIRRWGTNSPILTVPVTITYLSADTTGNDPGIFTPVFLVGSSLTHTAALPAPAFTGTLLSVTPKNMVANQALQSTFTTSAGSLTRYMLLVNTTRGNSRAILQRNTSGGTWQISQPVVPYPGTGVPSATEVNTWANGDVINGYIPLVVNLAVIGGVCRELLSPFSPFHIVQQLTQFSQAGSFPPVVVDDSVYSLFSDCMNWNITVSGGRTSLQCITLNCYFLGCLALNGAQVLVTLQVLAGVLHDFRGTGVLLASDTILEGHGDIQNCPSGWGPLFIDTGVVLRAEGVNGSNIAGVSVYGPGNFNQLAGTTTYLGTAAANFPIANITINGSTTAYSINNTTLNSNITLSAANLDAPAGPAGFGGNAFIPGVGGITNTTSTQSSALTQAAWFIDPVNGFDGYTGTNATFTSGTTGPLRTFAQLFSRWGSLTPLIAQLTTITLVNSGNVNDPWCATPIFINTGKITLQGTPTVVITSTIGTFTPAVRGGANTLATITSPGVASWATHVGSLIHDTTANATFWIHADLGGGVAQITNAVATPLAPGSFTPAPVTLVNGDTIQLLTPPTIFVTDLAYQGFGTAGILGLSQLTVSSSAITQTAAIDAAECVFTSLIREIENTSGSIYSSCIVTFISGLSIMTAGKLGQFSNFGAGIQGSSFDGDIIFAGNMNFTEGVITLRSVYLAGLFLNETPISVFQTQTSATYGPSGRCLIWGPGTLAISSGAQCDATAGGTAVQKFVNTGGIQIDGVATANVWNSSSNAFSAPVSTTPANLDFFGSFQNPTTGSAIHINNVANPNYLTQTAWFVDPALGSDGYSGTNATFTSGTTGPLKTWAEVIRRYGTNSPRLRQSTTYTFVSSHTDNTDPVYFYPSIENGAVVSIQGSLGAAQQVATGTLSGVVAKNRSTPQLLNATLTAGLAAGQLIVNSTHSSRAWLFSLVSGTTWNISQPLVPITVPITVTGTEVDTWTNGDTYTVYNPVQVNIAGLGGVLADWNGSNSNPLTIYQLSVFPPVAADPLIITSSLVWFNECQINRILGLTAVGNPLQQQFMNCDFGAVNFHLESGPTQQGVIIAAGQNRGLSFNASNVAFQLDFILGSTNIQIYGPIVSCTTFYIASGKTLQLDGHMNFNVLWGPGSINVRGTSRLNYTAPALTSFLLTGSVTINSSTTAYSVGSGTGATLNGGITITPSNLDAPQGPSGFGGTAFIPGGGSITNGGL